jgi:hypothetical protein
MYPTKIWEGTFFVDKKLNKAIDELILTRMQDAELSKTLPRELKTAYNAVDKATEELISTLNSEQLPAYNNLDNALSHQNGEEKAYFFSKGISDGIRIVIKLMGGEQYD